MLMYIMLYIVLAHIMLLATLSNAVFLYNAYSLPLIFANAFRFLALSRFIDTVCLFRMLFSIIHSTLICWFS